MIDYQIHDISEKQLKFSYWFLTHKKFLIKIGFGLLILWCLITLAYGIYGFVNWGLGLSKEKELLTNLTYNPIDFSSFLLRHQPKPLIISQPQMLSSTGQTYDFIAQARNPNEDRGVIELSYQFVAGDFSTPIESIAIPPTQSVFLLSLGNESEKKLTVPELKIVRTRWQSLWNKEKAEAIIVTTSQPVFHQGGDTRSWVSVEATNESLKNIWEVPWQAVLYSGKRIVAANQIITEQFLAGETRKIEISWFDKLPQITQIDLIPVINIYEPNNFYETPGKAREDYY